MKKHVIVIGSGFAGLSAASFMARAGWRVTVLEKNASPGGRARQLTASGFTFDMGPSWYWMPDVFERYFKQFGKTVSDYYKLQRLDPSYRVYHKDGPVDIPADHTALKTVFETIETGSGKQLDLFLKEAEYKYRIGMGKLVYMPGLSVTELFDSELMKGVLKLDVFRNMQSHTAKYFKHPLLRQLIEFPVLFLGALPRQIPALYSLMNHADIVGGTWYPEGGMYAIVQAMYRLALDLGVAFNFEQPVEKMVVQNGIVKQVHTTAADGTKRVYEADAVIGSADYHHIETSLLPEDMRSYSAAYWNKRVMAPGSLIYYVGLNKKLSGITHHSLFFDTSFDTHADELYTNPAWPSDPLFYACTASVTDRFAAPEGHENLFLLVPAAAGLTGDDETLREHYFSQLISRMEKHTGQSIRDAVVYKSSFAHSDFSSEYNAFRGNAYGLANTLLQTSLLKPSCRSRKVNNLFYAGQLTVPGPGVPPSLISGEIAARELIKTYRPAS